jgi:hypothetical protein
MNRNCTNNFIFRGAISGTMPFDPDADDCLVAPLWGMGRAGSPCLPQASKGWFLNCG